MFGFVRICSGLFRVVRGVPRGLTAKVDNGVDGVVGFAALLGFGVGAGVDGGESCQPLVTCGKCVVAGGVGGAAALWWGGRHGAALLFWCERSESWGKWGVWWETVGVWGAVIGVLESVGGRSVRPTPLLTSPLEADLRITPEFGDAGRSALSGRVGRRTAKFGVARRSAGRGEGPERGRGGMNWGREWALCWRLAVCANSP